MLIDIPEMIFYPLAVGLCITIFLEQFNLIQKFTNQYIIGLIVMWISAILVYYVIVKPSLIKQLNFNKNATISKIVEDKNGKD